MDAEGTDGSESRLSAHGRVLIVDDEQNVRQSACEALAVSGYQALAVEDTVQALAELARIPYDVVLADIYMPGMSGTELLNEINLRFPDVKVILITGQPSYETAVESVRHNAFDYLAKPLRLDAMREVVGRAVESKRLLDLQRQLEIERRQYQQQLEQAVLERTNELDRAVESMHEQARRRDQAELELQRSEERYRSLVENVADWIWEVDQDARFTFSSAQVTNVLKYQPEEMIGRTLFDFMEPDEAERNRKLLAKHAKGKQHINNQEATLVRSNGLKIIVQTQASPKLDERGELLGYIGICRDVTLQRLTTNALKERNEQLRSEIAERKQAQEALAASEKKLSETVFLLEQKHTALRELTAQVNEERDRIEQRVLANTERLLLPLLTRMRMRASEPDRQALDMLESNLRSLTSSFGHSISMRKLKLTQREIEISSMIKQGMTSKEIAGLLNISQRSVETHRNNIRKKLEISGSKINLITFLREI